MNYKAIILLLFALVLTSFQNTQYEAKVVAVLDGDTIEVLKEGKAVRIRLMGIDSPEKSQAFGTKAKQFTSDKVFGKIVTVKPKEKDRYGRTIADVYLEDGTWLNKAIVVAGFAWHYKRYSDDQELTQAEENARKLKAGLWIEALPVEPWNYRNKINK